MIIDTDEIYKTLIPQDFRLPGCPVKHVAVTDSRAMHFVAWYQVHPVLNMSDAFRDIHKNATHRFDELSGYVNRMECTIESSKLGLVEFTVILFTEKDMS